MRSAVLSAVMAPFFPAKLCVSSSAESPPVPRALADWKAASAEAKPRL